MPDVKSLLTRERLTAAHHLAYSWVLDRLGDDKKSVLDFGSRYSLLPTLLALKGHDVTATDRDPGVTAWQADHARAWGVKFPAHCWHPGSEDQLTLPKFDAVTACWAIQHNEPETQGWLAHYLGRLLKPGGSLLIVGAFKFGESVYEEHRADPLWRLSGDGHAQHVIEPSGLQLKIFSHFYYVHATQEGEFCSPKMANSVAYELVKP